MGQRGTESGWGDRKGERAGRERELERVVGYVEIEGE